MTTGFATIKLQKMRSHHGHVHDSNMPTPNHHRKNAFQHAKTQTNMHQTRKRHNHKQTKLRFMKCAKFNFEIESHNANNNVLNTNIKCCTHKKRKTNRIGAQNIPLSPRGATQTWTRRTEHPKWSRVASTQKITCRKSMDPMNETTTHSHVTSHQNATIKHDAVERAI